MNVLLALIVIYIPKATFVIKLWLQKFRWVIEDLNPSTSDLETNTSTTRQSYGGGDGRVSVSRSEVRGFKSPMTHQSFCKFDYECGLGYIYDNESLQKPLFTLYFKRSRPTKQKKKEKKKRKKKKHNKNKNKK